MVKKEKKSGSASAAYHHGNLRQSLIDTAVQMIGESGAQALSLRQIAVRAGVSHTAPYRHFKDKNAILEAVAVQGFEMMLEMTCQRIEADPGSELEQFAVIGLSCIDFAISWPSHYRVMFGTRSYPSGITAAIQPRSSKMYTLLSDTIAACIQKGFLKKGDLQEMTLAAWAIVHGFAMLLIDQHIHPDQTDSERLEPLKHSIVTTLYQGLRP